MRTIKEEGWGRLKKGTARSLASVLLNGSESRILWAIVYKTISHNKKTDWIPESQFLEMTGIATWNQWKAIKGLIKKGVIHGKEGVYGLCKGFIEFEATSNQMGIKEATSNQKESTSNQIENNIQTDVIIRSSHKNNHKKGLSPFEDEDKNKKVLENIGDILKTIKRTKIKTKKNQ